jgi:hypothetical protein
MVLAFYRLGLVFLRPCGGAHFLAFFGGGCLGAGQQKFWDQRAAEQHHG